MSLSASDPPARNFARRFEPAFARLQVTILEACAREVEWTARVAAAIRAALCFAAADPDSARALTVDALAQGRGGIRRRQRAIEHFAELLGAAVPEDTSCPPITAEAMVGAIFSLVAERIYAGNAEGLPSMTTDLVEFVLLPYTGDEGAPEWAEAPA